MKKELIPMAICYDFDGTLSPGNMQEYGWMKALHIKNPKEFWKKAALLGEAQGADEVAAYMYQMMREAKKHNQPIHRETLKATGKNIALFKGVPTWFNRINQYAQKQGIQLKHYIISSGLKEIVLGTPIAKNFTEIFASSFMYDENGNAIWPAVVLNYTSKTQFIFRINKGCEDICDKKGVNAYMPTKDRAVPFAHMIYVGDGDTDIPCMQIIRRHNGHAIAVYNPDKKGARQKVTHLMTDRRVNMIAPGDYRSGSVLDKYIKAIIDKIKAVNALQELEK
ncbi:MAG: haloacid dehalogenase-like hydrolase [Alphaproteobacteria bacterium]